MKLSVNERQSVIEALKTLKKAAEEGTVADTSVGICDNLSEIMDTGYQFENFYLDGLDIVAAYSHSWEEYSGERYHPIDGGEVYEKEDKLWEGEQLKKRLSLIDHIISSLEKE